MQYTNAQPTYICTSSLHARYIYVHICAPESHQLCNARLHQQHPWVSSFFPQPQKLEIDFLISHIHKTVEVASSPSCGRACAHGLQFSKIFRHHLQKARDTRVFCDTPKISKISLHRGMCTKPKLPGVFDAVPAGFQPHRPWKECPDIFELEKCRLP